MTERGNGKRTSLYLKDEELYKELRHAAKEAWFKKFGESLSDGDLLMKVLQFFIESVADNIDNDIKRKNIHKYARTGFQDI